MRKSVRIFMLVLVACGILFFIVQRVWLSRAFVAIQPREIGVVVNMMTGELGAPLLPGSHLINPFTQTVILYPNVQQELTMSGSMDEGNTSGTDAVEARTQDGQITKLDVTLIYMIDPDRVNDIHTHWGNQYNTDFIAPTAREIIREVIGRFTGEDLYGGNRILFDNTIQNEIMTRFAEEGFILNDFLIRDMTFSDAFRANMELQAVATQQALQQPTQAVIDTQMLNERTDGLATREALISARETAVAIGEADLATAWAKFISPTPP